MSHIPVLLQEVIEILNPKPGEFHIDGTIGEGGHSKEIVKRIEPGGTLLGMDWDKDQIEKAKKKKLNKSDLFTEQVRLVHPNVKKVIEQGNYVEIPNIIKKYKLGKADGLLLDLGFSSRHLESGRGFSFQKDEPLDMRYNADNDHDQMTAEEVVNSYSEKELADIIWKYGEEKRSRNIAKAIVEARKKERIVTTGRLVRAVEKVIRHGNKSTSGRHPATKTFQALRIYVNQELENMEAMLQALHGILGPGGRAAIITFHSLEDKIVKIYFRQYEEKGIAKRINKKVIKPTREEILANPRSRSAKLRGIIFVRHRT